MDLKSLHLTVSESISRLDFGSIWPGFEPLRFALYDEDKCFFGGKYIEKTDAFCANTSIVYEGEQIAIWKMTEDIPLPVLTSKMVHEMFHGYQGLKGWSCWPNELEALFRYEYDAENLSLKMRENRLLLSLIDSFDSDAFRELLSLRRLRSERFPYAFGYELKTEEIEGTANYVEWQVLKQLDAGKAKELADRMRAVMTKPEQLFPIRISCYYTGALMANALIRAGLYDFGTAGRPVLEPLLRDAVPASGSFPEKESCLQDVSEAVSAFRAKTEEIIQGALEKNEIVLTGPLELVYVNIYDARCLNGYLTSTFFLMYRDGEGQKLLQGNFVIRMRDGKTIDAVYRW